MSCNSPHRRPSGSVQPDLLRQQPRQVRHFQRVPQHVLRIAGAEVKPAQIVEHFLVQADDVGLEGRLLAEAANMLLDVFLGLLDDLFDSGRMNAAVLDQPFERDLGDLAANAVETGDDHHPRRVVDDHVDAGGLLEGADVAPLAADDPALSSRHWGCRPCSR